MQKGYDESLQRINEKTGYNISKEEFLLLAGYIFVNEGKSFLRRGEHRTKIISYYTPALVHGAIVDYYNSIDYIKRLEEEWSDGKIQMETGYNTIIENPHIYTKADGKTELSSDELFELVKMIKNEIERVEGENVNYRLSNEKEPEID